MIKKHVIEEGHVKAVKDTGDFGGCNMWHFYVKDSSGCFRDVQWMSLDNIQPFFKTPLPRYEQKDDTKYKIKLHGGNV